jgi:transposase
MKSGAAADKLSWRSSLNQEEPMKSATTPHEQSVPGKPVLCVSFELDATQWKMSFSPGLGQRARRKTVRARDLEAVQKEIQNAKARFGLPEEARVVSCYEAGRDGFWLDRALKAMGVENVVVDSASIEVNRRARRTKTDRLDGDKLLGMLLRWVGGETRVWSVVRVPSAAEEDQRQLHRELRRVKNDHTRLTNRIKGLLVTQGVELKELRDLPAQLDRVRLWNGEALPKGLRATLEREWEQVKLLRKRVSELEAERRRLLRSAEDAGSQCACKLLRLGAIGPNAAWLFALEFFSWRQFKNRRQIGALAGLTSTPYRSGTREHEQGISKAGNRWIRGLAIEIAWGWLRYQPQSQLSQWYQERFGRGSTRVRKIGIVALARKLLIELWKYLETGTPPAGAVLKEGTLRA